MKNLMCFQVSRLFRHGNRITFIRDLEQRLSEVLAMKASSSCKHCTINLWRHIFVINLVPRVKMKDTGIMSSWLITIYAKLFQIYYIWNKGCNNCQLSHTTLLSICELCTVRTLCTLLTNQTFHVHCLQYGILTTTGYNAMQYNT